MLIRELMMPFGYIYYHPLLMESALIDNLLAHIDNSKDMSTSIEL